MWNEPYLETCCRAALHRLYLCGAAGRPAGTGDFPCLRRLTSLGLCHLDPDGKARLTATGLSRHANEILKGRQSADLGAAP